MEYTTVRVPKETVKKLCALKVHPRQALWEVIESLL